MTRPNPCGLKLRKIKYKRSYLEDGHGPKSGEEAWRGILKQCRIATGTSPSGFHVDGLDWVLRYHNDPEAIARRLERQARRDLPPSVRRFG